MKKKEFLEALRVRLVALPSKEVEERLAFLSEMIDDRIDEGLSEEEAVADMGTVESVAKQIISEVPLITIIKEKLTPRRAYNGWEIAGLTVTSPIWIVLLIAAAAVAISLYVSVWAVVISLWAAFVSLAGGGLFGIAVGAVWLFGGETLNGVLIMGAGAVCVGSSAYMFYGCKLLTAFVCKYTKKAVLWVKNKITKGDNK